MQLNETHNPSLKSWVESANVSNSDFPIQNLPFAVFRKSGSEEQFRIGVAIGDQVVDLAMLSKKEIFAGKAADALSVCDDETMNKLMALTPEYWSALRLSLSRTLRQGASNQGELEDCLLDMQNIEYALQAEIGDYTDFYTSIHHATNVGKLFRPDNPLLPNYQWVPIGYHGRSSSIQISSQEFHRPQGQTRTADTEQPSFGPSKRLDYELEVGIFIGPGNKLGEPIPIGKAEQHVFGLCLFNDWSARDIQAWEYQPLGPFLSKSFASTLSPWVVTIEALAPYRSPWSRPIGHPQPLTYLQSESNNEAGSLDLNLEVLIQTPKMREANLPAESLTKSNFQDSYWTIAQMVAHHTVNGCNLNPGDLFGSGTQSGESIEQVGSMLELTEGGKSPITLENGETRTFVEDGDTIVMRGHCAKKGAARIGFGEVVSTVLPAI